MKRLVIDVTGVNTYTEFECEWGDYVRYSEVKELEAENQKLREQRDAANAVIQELNRIIAGDTE